MALAAINRKLFPSPHERIAGPLSAIAQTRFAMGDGKSAVAYMRQALTQYRALLGDDHLNTITTVGNLGYILAEFGDAVEAESLFELPVAPRIPDGQRSPGTECGKGGGNAAIVIQSCVVGGRERRRAVVHVQEHDVKATGVRPQREPHIPSLQPDARIP